MGINPSWLAISELVVFAAGGRQRAEVESRIGRIEMDSEGMRTRHWTRKSGGTVAGTLIYGEASRGEAAGP